MSISSLTSDNNDDDITSIKSYCSSIFSPCHVKKYNRITGQNISPIPDVSNWDKFKVFQYLSDRGLPQIVTEKIINNVRYY